MDRILLAIIASGVPLLIGAASLFVTNTADIMNHARAVGVPVEVDKQAFAVRNDPNQWRGYDGGAVAPASSEGSVHCPQPWAGPLRLRNHHNHSAYLFGGVVAPASSSRGPWFIVAPQPMARGPLR